MSEQLKIQKKAVKILGVRQNIYVGDTVQGICDTVKHVPEKVYPSLERKNLPNGFVENVELKDYPINSKSVSSYADSADYRNDPNGAVANAPNRVNMGDISQVQEFLANNPHQAVEVFRNVMATLDNKAKQKPVGEPAPAPDLDNGGAK